MEQLMNVTEPVIVDGGAFIGWHHLPPESRTQIQKALASLAGLPSDRWSRDDVELWRPEENIFALHTYVGPDHLLVLFQPDGQAIRVLHLVLKETIDRYFTPKKNGA
jgi:hypothetical protein